MYELKIQKNKIRSRYIEQRRSLDPQVKQSRDSRICSLFMSLVTYRYADTLLMYYPTRREIDVLPIVRRALQGGKQVAFPRCNVQNHTMEFYLVRELSDLRENGAFGTPEPKDHCARYMKNEADGKAVCVIPAIVYDTSGYRLGYGKGFYDRYLSDFRGVKVGMVYQDFIVPNVPRGRFDLSVDVLVTEKGVKALHAD